jgi:hypothetical protein
MTTTPAQPTDDTNADDANTDTANTDDANTDDANATTPVPTTAESDETNLSIPLPTAAASDDADTLVIPAPATPAASATATTPAAPPAAPAEPWLSDAGYSYVPRPVPSGPPPVRWGGIVWGALLILLAVATLVTVSSPVRLAGVTVWLATLTPGAAIAVWIAVVGIVIVISALLSAISATQRSRRRRRV